MLDALPYRYIVAADFEFEFGGHASFEEAARAGERPRPVCMVAKELRSGQEWRLLARRNLDRRRHSRPGRTRCSLPTTPAPSSDASALSAGQCRPTSSTCSPNFATALMVCQTPAGAGLIGALAYFGLDSVGATEKDEMRALILGGGPWSEDEREAEFSTTAPAT